MQILSETQFAAWKSLTLAPIEELRDGVWAVPLPLPVPGLPWVFSYFMLDTAGGLHVIDAGWDYDPSWTAFTAALDQLGLRMDAVRSVTVTHFHPDHLGMAERIRGASGARVGLLALEQHTLDTISVPGAFDAAHEHNMLEWGVPKELWAQLHAPSAVGVDFPEFHADVELADGDRLDIPGREVRVLSTPGHTPGELSLHDVGAAILYSGDHVLPNQFPGIGLGGQPVTNPIADYLGALDKVSALGDVEVDPGHGYRFRGLRERVDATRAHHLARSGEVAGILERGGKPSVWEVASKVFWTSGWDNLRPSERLSALGQTALHIDYLSSDQR